MSLAPSKKIKSGYIGVWSVPSLSKQNLWNMTLNHMPRVNYDFEKDRYRSKIQISKLKIIMTLTKIVMLVCFCCTTSAESLVSCKYHQSLKLHFFSFFYIGCQVILNLVGNMYCMIPLVFLMPYMHPYESSQMAQWVKNLPVIRETQETQIQSLSQEDPLMEGMATYSSILVPWTEGPGGLQSICSQRVGRDRSNWACWHVSTYIYTHTRTHTHTHTHTPAKVNAQRSILNKTH